jgi:4-amino-4-deoxy-L-arabinose transferase-like glycosyltransferase
MLNKIKKFSQPETLLPIYHDDPEYSKFWSRPNQLFFLIFSIALTLRIAQFFFLRTSDPSFSHLLYEIDTKTYDDLAQTILAGDWLLSSVPIHYMGPLYAYFLAVVYGIFGHHYEAAHAAQYFLGAASAAIIFLAARLWFSNRVAFFAGLIPALSATLIVYEGYLLPESLIFFLAALIILVTGLARRNPTRWWYWLLLGFILGFTAIQRANILLCTFGIVFWIAFGFNEHILRRRSISIVLFITGIVLAITPVTLHNRIAGGQWTLITSNGPANFYIGNGVEANGGFHPGPIFEQHSKEVAAGTTTWMELLIDDIKSDPSRWAALMLKKTYLFWAAYDPPDNFNYELYKQFTPLTRSGQLPYYLVVALGFAGMIAAWPRRRFLLELYFFVFLCMISVVIVFVSGRFRLLTMAPMSIFAAVALWKMATWIQSNQWRNFTAACASVMALLFLLNIYSLEQFPIRMNDYFMLARYYDKDGNTAGSIATMQEAVRTFETAPKGDAKFEEMRGTALFFGRSQLARSYIKVARWQDAKRVLELQMQSNNYDDSLALMLVHAYTQLGEKNQAATLARQMLNKYPDNSKWQSIIQTTENLPK